MQSDQAQSSVFNDEIWQQVGNVARSTPTWATSLLLDELLPALDAHAPVVLDLGCGPGYDLQVLVASGKCEVVGADRSAVALEWARQRAPQSTTVLVGNDERLPLSDNSVDLVWCSDTLEHVTDTQTVLSELRRVLREGGKLAVVTPNHSRGRRAALALLGWDEHFDPFSPHLRFYTKSSLRGALSDCGFEVQSLTAQQGQLVCVARRA